MKPKRQGDTRVGFDVDEWLEAMTGSRERSSSVQWPRRPGPEPHNRGVAGSYAGQLHVIFKGPAPRWIRNFRARPAEAGGYDAEAEKAAHLDATLESLAANWGLVRSGGGCR